MWLRVMGAGQLLLYGRLFMKGTIFNPKNASSKAHVIQSPVEINR